MAAVVAASFAAAAGGLPVAQAILSGNIGTIQAVVDGDFSYESALCAAFIYELTVMDPAAFPLAAAAPLSSNSPPRGNPMIWNGLANRGGGAPAAGNDEWVAGQAIGVGAEGSPEEHEFWSLIIALRPAMHRFVISLSQCEQVKPMDKNNVRSFVLSLNRVKIKGSSLVQVVSKYYGLVPSIRGTAEFSAAIQQNRFLRYHCSFSSTAALIQRADRELTSLGLTRFTAATMGLVNASANAPWDPALNALIPEAARGVARAYFEAVGFDCGDWYQGDSALADIPAPRKALLIAGFKAAVTLAPGAAAVAAAVSAAAIDAALGPGA